MLLLFVPFRCHIVLMLRVICFCPLHLSSTPDFSFHEPRIKIALSVMQPLWSSECEISCHCDRLYMYCYRLLWSSMSRELVLSGAVLSCHILLCQFNVFYDLSHCLLSLSCMMSLQFNVFDDLSLSPFSCSSVLWSLSLPFVIKLYDVLTI